MNERHGIGSGSSYKEPSQPYFARTPYTLRWSANATYKLYGKEDPTVKAKDTWTSATVTDAATGEVIARSPRGGMSGELSVPRGGRHRVTIYSLGTWTADFVEDRAALETAARRGELKDGVTVDAARSGSLRTKNESIDKVKADVIGQLEARRGSIGDDSVIALRADVERAAQLATSEKDFTDRFRALSAATVERIKASRAAGGNSQTATPATRSTWDGRGLPPGMSKR